MTCAYSEAGGTLQRLELLKSAPSQRDNSLWHVHVARSHDQGMTMHLTELLAKKSALDEEIARAKKSEATVALRRVHELVTEFGLTTQQVFPLLPARGKKQGVAKYRNPVTGATWTGRGKPPAWILGKDRNEFLVAQHVQPEGPFLAEMAAAAGRNLA